MKNLGTVNGDFANANPVKPIKLRSQQVMTGRGVVDYYIGRVLATVSNALVVKTTDWIQYIWWRAFLGNYLK